MATGGVLEPHWNQAFETMRSANGKQAGTLKDEISRQLGSESTHRYYNAQPAFRVADSIPDYLRDLLDRLEEAERGVKRPS